MKKYIIRSLKYVLRMVVLIGVALLITKLLRLLDPGRADVLRELFLSWRGAVIWAVLLVLAATYPRISFETVRLRADLVRDRQAIADAFVQYGYAEAADTGGTVIFRRRGFVQRLVVQFDDAVSVTQHGEMVEIEGLKRVVPRVATGIRANLRS